MIAEVAASARLPAGFNVRSTGRVGLVLLLLLAGCRERDAVLRQDEPEAGAPDAPTSTPETATPAPARTGAAPTPVTPGPAAPAADPATPPETEIDGDFQSQYTSLQTCKLVLSVPEEAGYSVQTCPGVGVTLKLIESDGRQDLAIIYSSDREHFLKLPSVVGKGGFSALGARVEWRGRRAVAPTALIVRYNVVEDPNTPDRPVSYLAVARLSAGSACVIGRIPPGPNQNAAARRLADAGGSCMEASILSEAGQQRT